MKSLNSILLLFLLFHPVHAQSIEDMFDMSVALFEEGMYEQSLNELEKIESKTDKPFAALYNNKGLIYERQKKPEKAEQEYLKALAVSPENSDAMNNLGFLYAESGKNLIQALSLCRRAVQSDPDNLNYMDSLGWAYFKAGLFERSVTTFEEIISRNPKFYKAYYRLGLAYENRKMFFKAIDYYDEVDRICTSENTFNDLYFLANIAILRIMDKREEFQRMIQRYKIITDRLRFVKVSPEIRQYFHDLFFSYRKTALYQLCLEFYNQENKRMSVLNYDYDLIEKKHYSRLIEPNLTENSEYTLSKNSHFKHSKYGYNPFIQQYIQELKEMRRISAEESCVYNMHAIYSAWMLYNMEHESVMVNPDIETLVTAGYLPETPQCPFGGTYILKNGRISCTIHQL